MHGCIKTTEINWHEFTGSLWETDVFSQDQLEFAKLKMRTETL